MGVLWRRIFGVKSYLRDWHVGLLLGAACVSIHVLIERSGTQFTASTFFKTTLKSDPHLLPVRLLRQNLVDNVSHLHTQPPLFNFATGLLLQIAPTTRVEIANIIAVALSTVLVVAAYFVARELSVPRWLAFAGVATLILGDPAQLLYPAQYSVALPTAALVTCMGWCAARWLRTERALNGVVFGLLGLVLLMINPIFQIYTVAIMVVPLVVSLRHRWRSVVLALLAPIIVSGTWAVNDLIQFNTLSSTSWLGMSAASSTTATDSPSDIQLMIKQGILSPNALIPPFSCLSDYGKLGHRNANGVLALTIKEKTPCATSPGGYLDHGENYNNIGYLAISSRYLSDDLNWIEHRPLSYLRNLADAARFWVVPAEDLNGTPMAPAGLSAYINFYEHVILGRSRATVSSPLIPSYSATPPTWSTMSPTIILISVLNLLLLPVVMVWRRRQLTRSEGGLGWWLWLVTSIVFVISTMTTLGANSLFRFELGGLPVAGALAALVWLIRRPLTGPQIDSLRKVIVV